MKIAIFHHLPDGGAKIALYEQLKRLKLKHTLHLYGFLSEDGEFNLSALCDKTYLYPYHAVPAQLKKGALRFIDDLRSFTKLKTIHREIARTIDKESYDLVFAHNSRLTQAPYLLQFIHTPSVYYCHEPYRAAYEAELRLEKEVGMLNKSYESLNRSIRKRIDRNNARAANRIATNSKYTQKYIYKAYEKDSQVCLQGVDASDFKPNTIKTNRNGLLFVASKTQIKGFNLLESALRSIPKNRRPTLKVIEPRKNTFSVDRAQLIRAYASAELTICTSVNEPFGLVAIESMACETPVIAVNEGGYRETIIDGQTGYLIKRTPNSLAQRILRITGDKQLARRLGQAGRKHVIKNWDWDKNIIELEKLLIKVARQKP